MATRSFAGASPSGMIRKERQLGNFQSPLSGRIAGPMTGGRLFACRHCYRLSYATQRSGPMDRAHRRLARLHQRLAADYDGPDKPPPKKPKWMRWKTYSRIIQQIEAGQGRLDVVFTSGAQRMLARVEKAEHRSRRR